MLERRLRYGDLVAGGIVKNRTTLRNRIKNDGFPRGKRTGPNERTWGEDEVQLYVDSCPIEAKPAPTIKNGCIGRPRKGD